MGQLLKVPMHPLRLPPSPIHHHCQHGSYLLLRKFRGLRRRDPLKDLGCRQRLLRGIEHEGAAPVGCGELLKSDVVRGNILHQDLRSGKHLLQQLASVRRPAPLLHVHPDHEADRGPAPGRGVRAEGRCLLPDLSQARTQAMVCLKHAVAALPLPPQLLRQPLRGEGGERPRPLLWRQQQQSPSPCLLLALPLRIAALLRRPCVLRRHRHCGGRRRASTDRGVPRQGRPFLQKTRRPEPHRSLRRPPPPEGRHWPARRRRWAGHLRDKGDQGNP
mmetsp:Transcript_68177/g.221930  ORF Transcript_68177/g.221930 Transcript_68177/m.221930 type:complete len:274 (-) Transcript_68177:12-833(-)